MLSVLISFWAWLEFVSHQGGLWRFVLWHAVGEKRATLCMTLPSLPSQRAGGVYSAFAGNKNVPGL